MKLKPSLAGAVAVMLSLASSSFASTSLFTPVPTAALRGKGSAGPENPGLLRSRTIAAQRTALDDIVTTASGNSIVLDLFDDAKFLITLNRQTDQTTNSATWTGRVAGKPMADFTMAVVEEATAIDLRMPDGITYSVRYRGNGHHEAMEISESAQGKCGTDASLGIDAESLAQAGQKTAGDVIAGDPADQIDILVAYTAEAETKHGGENGMQSLINLAISQANVAYVNSQITLTLRKAGTLKVDYTPHATDMIQDLNRLRNKTDGFLDEVHARRDQVGADMVCLLRGTTANNFCGYAYVMTTVSQGFESNAFSVLATGCISGQTFTHELGHNMGCQHDRPTAGTARGAYSYSYGYHWGGSSNTQYRSLMAYAPGTRLNYFSNPLVTYLGLPTGTATEDNARTINNTRATIANFRQSIDTAIAHVYVSENPVKIRTSETLNATRIINIGTTGTTPMSYTVTDNQLFLTINPDSGTVAINTSNSHTLNFAAAGLPIGSYPAEISIVDSANPTFPKTVDVELTVAPSNDNFADAQPMAGASGTLAANSLTAIRETGDPTNVGEYGSSVINSIWFKWQAPSAGTVTIDTIGSTYDTVLGVYTGALGSFTLIAQNDDDQVFTPRSKVNFTPTSGTTYYILIAGYNGAGGPTTLNWSSASAVAEWSVY